MTSFLRRHAAKGFTLIELLIVVIIIAILAAIAIPQFANTSGDAQEGALDANLSTMRSAIELYRIQHRNVLPSVASSDAGANSSACATAGGVPGDGDANSPEAFAQQLTYFSNVDGATCSVRVQASGYSLGPYLKTIPTEQITNPPSNAVVVVSTGTQDTAPAAATGGYQFDNRSGRLVMNSNAIGRRNKAYSTY
jgi:prepilin-type N-terminal cleavage/methylation domain-containing protein